MSGSNRLGARRWRNAIILAGFVGLMCSSCGVLWWHVPAQDDPDVRGQAERIGKLLAADPSLSGGEPDATCRVRILGQDDDATFVWAGCSAPGGYAMTSPVRVEGDRVMTPWDGSRYEADVERLFPPALARMILDRDPAVVGP
jgi:hypothetical protein